MDKKQYIEEIKKMLENTKDIQLVDYIYELLKECA